MEWIPYIMVVMGGYLLGSIPTGFLVGRARGVDIRKLGSGNIGATNVFRSLGKTWGLVVFFGDALKGFIACGIATPFIFSWFSRAGSPTELMVMGAGVGALLGHMYPLWLGFRGGKGIATAVGVFLALAPLPITLSLALWGLVLALSRIVSVASIGAAASLPLFIWLCHGSGLLIGVTTGLSCLAIFRHRSNIQRLIQGTESRIGDQAKPSIEPGNSDLHQP